MSATILIVEDETKLAELLRDYLQSNGFVCILYDRGDTALERLRQGGVDLVLLDLMLPGLDGMEVCRQSRSFSTVPIIMVTARVEEVDRLVGLELGADDYICKPFSPREVVARVKAVLRRSQMSPEKETGHDTLQLDPERYLATLDGRSLDLTAVEFNLLQILAAAPGRIFGRNQLMDQIYPNQRIVSDRTIDSHIKKLRKKIDAVAPGRQLIHSLYGVGYKYECEN